MLPRRRDGGSESFLGKLDQRHEARLLEFYNPRLKSAAETHTR
jgi:hypothetical protein